MAGELTIVRSLTDELTYYQRVMDEFVASAKRVVLSQEVYKGGWNAKEIIAHVVDWHEYYVTIVKALAKNEAPPLKKGSAHKNDAATPMASQNSREKLIERLLTAHQQYVKYVKLVKTSRIPYTLKAKDYTPAEYVRVIADHIERHGTDLRKAVRPTLTNH